MRPKVNLINILLLLIVSLPIFGQRLSEGEAYFNSGKYEKALSVFRVLLSKKPNDITLNYKAGRCAYELNDYVLASTYFAKSGSKNYLKSNFYLGQAYYNTYSFEKAVEAYSRYLLEVKDSTSVQETRVCLEKATLAAGMLDRIEDVAIVDSVEVAFQDVFAHFKLSKDVGSFVRVRAFLLEEAESVGFLAGRGDRLLFSREVNGQSELFIAFKLLDSWGEAQPLSAQLNTAYNDRFPYMMSDGVTIYFGSQGGDNIGGYDIFLSRFSSQMNDYLPPQNVGMPFNSIYNDYMMVVDDLAGIGWWVTDRFASPGKVTIYTFLPNSEKVIYRNLTEDTKREYALLGRYRVGTKRVEVLPLVVDTDTGQEDSRQFTFVVSDSVEYHKLSDFNSSEAKVLYGQYLLEEEEIGKLSTQIETLRETLLYTESIESQAELSEQLTHLEHSLLEKEHALKRIFHEVLVLEINYLTSRTP